jgi:hypothetical protein
MRGIFKLDESLTEAELQRLTTGILFHLLEKCGGEVSLDRTDAARLLVNLHDRMIYMKVDHGIMLRIVPRPPELADAEENAVAL